MSRLAITKVIEVLAPGERDAREGAVDRRTRDESTSGEAATPRERVRDAIIAHIDELTDQEMIAAGRWLAAIERGRQRQGIVRDESPEDLGDSISYLTLQLEARRVPSLPLERDDVPLPTEHEQP